jgi:Tfp pilus assembly protein PilP
MRVLPKRNRPFQIFLFGAIVLSVSCAFAAKEAVYKDKRPMKKVLEGQKETPGGGTSEEAGKPGKETYDPRGKTDPFKSFIAEQEAVEEKRQRKPKTYLETLDLSQLELIAIIVGPRGNYAMVKDSKGVGHIITKGTPIGTHSGVVHAITDKEVMIREEYKDFRGHVQHKDIAKKLPSLLE